MSNTTPGPEDENREHEQEPSAEPDAPADETREPEPDAGSDDADSVGVADETELAEPIASEPIADAATASEPAGPESTEPSASETVTAAYAAHDAPAPTWAPEPGPAERETAEPVDAEPAQSEDAAVPAEPAWAEAAANHEATRSEPAAPVIVPVTPVYVTAPTPPRAKGNRGVGILIVVLAAIAFAVVYAAVSLGYFALTFDGDSALRHFEDYVVSWAFWVPVAAFFVIVVLLVAIVNRGGWWAYVLGGFVVGVIVYFAYLGGALLQVQAWTLTGAQVNRLIGQLWTNPLMLGAAIVAREVTVWFGAWIAARGKRVRQRNLDAQRDFDREVAEGPLTHRATDSPSWSER